MTTFAVLATGESMSQAVADSVRHMRRVVVNDAYKLAPDADALVANDASWWNAHPLAFAFKGRKFSTNPRHQHKHHIERVETNALIETGTNSGLVGVHVAIKLYGAKRVELYGFDMRGTHYFGPHKGLANTRPERFDVFKRQFEQYAKALPKDVAIINKTPGSALACFPFET